MGTLDDAIREHLELKRKHGADDAEIAELEDSAFGPPERPGAEEGGDAGALVAPAEEAAAETTLMPSEPVGEAVAPSDAQPEPEQMPDPGSSAAELTPAEQARQEYPQLQDTIPHEAVPRPEPVQSTEEQDALEINLFESEDDEEAFDIGDVDLELDQEEVLDQQGSAQIAEPAIEPEPEAAPVEDDAREHAIFDPDPDDSDEVEAISPPPMVDPDPTEEGHDVLEDTPEFLKDAPESDEMWFEQDKPQDFDFDDS